jgi:hypothetical protein
VLREDRQPRHTLTLSHASTALLRKIQCLSILAVLGAASVSITGEAKLLDKVVAIIGSEVVTLADIKKFRADLSKANFMQMSGQTDPKIMQKDDAVLEVLVRTGS